MIITLMKLLNIQCDKNSLYGGVMLNSKLPTSEFIWAEEAKLNEFNYFLNYSIFLEVDIDYDPLLYDLHREYYVCAKFL